MMYTEEKRVMMEFPSSRNPAKKYHVTKDTEGILYCDCMAWRFQKKPSHLRQCKHINSYVEQVASQASKPEGWELEEAITREAKNLGRQDEAE